MSFRSSQTWLPADRIKPKINLLRGNLWRVLITAALIGFNTEVRGVSDPTLNTSFQLSGQSAILSWNTFPGVLYQVEAANVLGVWSNLSTVMTGTGATLSYTNSQATQNQLTRPLQRVPDGASWLHLAPRCPPPLSFCVRQRLHEHTREAILFRA
jgi:hypothetical protein